MIADTKTSQSDIETLFSIGAQYGYSRSRRHPSTEKYIFGVKNNVEIFDLEKTQEAFTKATDFVTELGEKGKMLLLVSGKPEARSALEKAHEKTKLPYVSGRWIGGTLTNFSVVRKRVERLMELRTKQEEGGLEQYTKHERLLMRREADRLAAKFGGIVNMEKTPDALFVIDPRQEHIAVDEARQLGIPIVALASSDCDVRAIGYPIPANDSNIKSIAFFVDHIAEAYLKGLEERSQKAAEKKDSKKTDSNSKDKKAK